MPKVNQAQCATCQDSGFVKSYPDPDSLGVLQPCPACSGDKQQQRIIEQCGLNESQRLAELSEFRVGQWGDDPNAKTYVAQRVAASKLARAAMESQAGILTYHGDFGSGKSFLLEIIAADAVRNGTPAFYGSFVAILDLLKNAMFHGGNIGAWDRLLTIPVLCIDEVTRFNDTAWAQDRLFALIDSRYQLRKEVLTVFATNDDPHVVYPPDESIGYLYSRMREGKIAHIQGDMREQVGKNE